MFELHKIATRRATPPRSGRGSTLNPPVERGAPAAEPSGQDWMGTDPCRVYGNVPKFTEIGSYPGGRKADRGEVIAPQRFSWFG